jgi:DNA-3-methyladenine glycosylase
MAFNRFGKKDLTVKEKINLTNGPAKIAQAFGIKREDNGKDLTDGEIFILDSRRIPEKNISVSKRIGIKKSVDLPWRFYISDNPYISKK